MKTLKAFVIAGVLLTSTLLTVACDKEKGSDDVNSQIETLVNKYFDSMEKGDYNEFASYQPDFYNQMYSDFATGYGYKNASEYFLECEYSYYLQVAGEGFTIDASIESIKQMSSDELKTGETAIKQTYGVDYIKLDDGYVFEIVEEVTGKSGTEKESYELMAIEIEGTLYLYNQYFEHLASME